MLDSQGNSAFSILAKYIGVFGNPANLKNEPMDMTAPVLIEPANEGIKMDMTSPVITKDQKMSFVLPFEFTNINQIPVIYIYSVLISANEYIKYS